MLEKLFLKSIMAIKRYFVLYFEIKEEDYD